MDNEYIPQPIDTSDIRLNEEVEQLVELVARNVHEVWAKSRKEQGWTYGAERNDRLKTHPCLIPYDKLPEEEKQYDRDTAVGTVKLLMKMGYNLSKAPDNEDANNKTIC